MRIAHVQNRPPLKKNEALLRSLHGPDPKQLQTANKLMVATSSKAIVMKKYTYKPLAQNS